MLVGLFKIRWVMNFVKRRIDKIWNPNNSAQRAKSKSYFWGEAKNKKGDVVVGRFTTSDGYDLTAWGTVEVAQYLLKDHNHKGYYTPSILIGKELMKNMPGYSGIEFDVS